MKIVTDPVWLYYYPTYPVMPLNLLSQGLNVDTKEHIGKELKKKKPKGKKHFQPPSFYTEEGTKS